MLLALLLCQLHSIPFAHSIMCRFFFFAVYLANAVVLTSYVKVCVYFYKKNSSLHKIDARACQLNGIVFDVIHYVCWISLLLLHFRWFVCFFTIILIVVMVVLQTEKKRGNKPKCRQIKRAASGLANVCILTNTTHTLYSRLLVMSFNFTKHTYTHASMCSSLSFFAPCTMYIVFVYIHIAATEAAAA